MAWQTSGGGLMKNWKNGQYIKITRIIFQKITMNTKWRGGVKMNLTTAIRDILARKGEPYSTYTLLQLRTATKNYCIQLMMQEKRFCQ